MPVFGSQFSGLKTQLVEGKVQGANPAVFQNLSTKTCVKLAFLKDKLGTFRGDSPAEGHDTPTTVGNRNRGCSPPSIKKYKCEQKLLCYNKCKPARAMYIFPQPYSYEK